jgi:hypothetical protein
MGREAGRRHLSQLGQIVPINVGIDKQHAVSSANQHLVALA